MAYRNFYISIEKFAELIEESKHYEGFVIGLGYAFTATEEVPPPFLRGFTYEDNVLPSDNRFILVRYQCLDNSSEAVKMSQENIFQEEEYYTVKPGDTLWSLSRKYKVSIDDLKKWNNIPTSEDTIKAGEKLVVREMPMTGKFSEKSKEIIEGISYGMAFTSTYLSAQASARYMRYPGGGGYFRNAKGKLYDFSVLDKQPNGKYVRGMPFIKNAADNAKNATRLARGFGIGLGVLTTIYSTGQFIYDPTFRNGFNVVGGVAGILYWPASLVVLYINTTIDYRDVHVQNLQTQVDVIEGNGQFKDLSRGAKLGWLMMFSGGSPTGPTGGF